MFSQQMEWYLEIPASSFLIVHICTRKYWGLEILCVLSLEICKIVTEDVIVSTCIYLMQRMLLPSLKVLLRFGL